MLITPIPGVYNYCNRWCERCQFTERCLVYADVRHHQALLTGTPQANPFADIYSAPPTPEAEEFFRELEEAQRQLTAEEHAENEREQRLVDHLCDADPLVPVVTAISQALSWNGVTAARMSSDPLLAEAREIVEHYALFIGAKVRRALHGYYEARNGSSISDSDGDAQGSAKVALLAVQELMPAVEVLALTFPDDEGLRVGFANLPVLRSLLLERFPHAMSFVRPGFDEDSACGAMTQ
jgi:hypothetical protein